MNRYRSRKRHIAEINVIPYIDVMLVLLVIFMITAPLLNQGVEIELPQAAANPLPPTEQRTLVLDIDRAGQYYLYLVGDAAEPADAEVILAKATALLSRDPNIPVLVKADTGIDYGTVIRAMTLLQQAGAVKIGLSTQPLENLEEN
ncbi:MAG: protein TolR [Gammaproteobacteria bacterium]